MKIIQLMALMVLGTCAVQSTAMAEDEKIREDGCLAVYDYPEPILKNGTFKLDKEKGLATEHMQLDKTVDLDIEMGGCEYVSRTYIFTVHGKIENQDISGVEYNKSIELLTRLESISGAEFMLIPEAKKALSDYAHLVVVPQQDVDIYIGPVGPDIFNTVNVKADVKDDLAIIRVNISSGPY